MSFEVSKNNITVEGGKRERLLLEQMKNPVDLITEEIKKRKSNCIIAYGEANHNTAGTLEYEATLLSKLLEDGHTVKKVFLEEQEFMMPEVKKFFATGEMSQELCDYLEHGFVRVDSLEGHSYKRKLIETCRALQIPVQFIDNQNVDDRDSDWEEKIQEEIGISLEGIYVLIAGTTHVSHASHISSHTPVVTQLDKIYPGSVVSLAGITTGFVRNEPRQAVYNNFLNDLEVYQTITKPWAVETRNSPYRNEFLTKSGRGRDRYSHTTAGEAFDLLVMIPGKDLRKHKMP